MTEKRPLADRRYDAWAIWNECQGVFTDAVFHWRSEAVEAAGRYGDGAKVVPVKVIVDDEDRWDFRHFDQDEWERLQERPNSRRDQTCFHKIGVGWYNDGTGEPTS